MHLLLFPSTTIQPQCFLLTGGAGAGLLAGHSPSCIKALDLRATINHGCREVLGSTCDPWERLVPARPFPSLGRRRKKAARKQGLPRADSFRGTRGDEEHECHSAAAPVQPGFDGNRTRTLTHRCPQVPAVLSPLPPLPTAGAGGAGCPLMPPAHPARPLLRLLQASIRSPLPPAPLKVTGCSLVQQISRWLWSCSIFPVAERHPISPSSGPHSLTHRPLPSSFALPGPGGARWLSPPHQQPPILLRCSCWARSEAEATSPGLHAAQAVPRGCQGFVHFCGSACTCPRHNPLISSSSHVGATWFLVLFHERGSTQMSSPHAAATNEMQVLLRGEGTAGEVRGLIN